MDKICNLKEFNEYSLADPEYFDWNRSFLELGWMNPKQKIRYEGFLRTVLDRSKTAFSQRVTVYYSVSLDGVEPFSIGLYGLETRRRLNVFVCEDAEDGRYWKVWKTLSAYGLRLFFR